MGCCSALLASAEDFFLLSRCCTFPRPTIRFSRIHVFREIPLPYSHLVSNESTIVSVILDPPLFSRKIGRRDCRFSSRTPFFKVVAALGFLHLFSCKCRFFCLLPPALRSGSALCTASARHFLFFWHFFEQFISPLIPFFGTQFTMTTDSCCSMRHRKLFSFLSFPSVLTSRILIFYCLR